MSDTANVPTFAQRVLRQQHIEHGPLRDRVAVGARPISPEVVGAVLHALADFTHNKHMVDVIVDGEALAAGFSFEPRVTSLGRYFHRLADTVEDMVSTEELVEREDAFMAAKALGRAVDYSHASQVTVPTDMLRTLLAAVSKGVL